MKFWQVVSFAEPEQLIDIARIAEEVGFEGVLCSDHLFYPGKLASRYPYSPDGAPPFAPDTPWPDPWVLFGAMAAATTRLRFSMGVYILPLRSPFEVAKAAATLAVLSGDRFALGCGAGWMREEFEVAGIDFASRGRRLDEMIVVMRKLWQGGMVEHHGEHFDFPALQMSPAPRLPIPVYVGGVSKGALRRTATLGNGWIGNGSDPAEVPGILERLTALRREAGREREPFETIVPLVAPPDLDVLRRLEDAGMTATVSYPFLYTLGPTSTLEQKRRYLEEYGERIIAGMR